MPTIGRVAMVYKGEYSSSKTYSRLDVVFDEGSSYVALKDDISTKPSQDKDNWVIIAAKGEQGIQGDPAPQEEISSAVTLYLDNHLNTEPKCFKVSEFDSEAIYNVGSCVLYEQKIYFCTEDNISGEWSSISSNFIEVKQQSIVDDTLSISGAAADAKVAGDTIKVIKDTLYTLDTTELSLSNRGIYINSGRFNPNHPARACHTPPISLTQLAYLELGLQDYLWFAYCYSGTTDNTGTHSVTPNYVSGIDPIMVTREIGDGYFRICIRRKEENKALSTDINDPTSDYYKILHALKIYKQDDTYKRMQVQDVANNVNEVLTIKDNIQINFKLDTFGYVRVNDEPEDGTIIASTTSPPISISTDYIDVSSYKSLIYSRCKTTANVGGGMAFYDENKIFLTGVPGIANQSERRYILHTITVPNNAKYARFTAYVDTDTYGNFVLTGKSKLLSKINSLYDPIPLDLHTRPANQGVLNCIKRARQMTDVVWSPKADLKRIFGIVSKSADDSVKMRIRGKFLAGKQYKGIPYSNNSPGAWIGFSVPIDRFVSSMCCPNSNAFVLSSFSDPTDKNRTDLASYYGAVCSTFVSYAINFPATGVTHFSQIPGLEMKYDIYDAENEEYHDLDDIELCDILLAASHVVIITDIIRDEMNHVTHIEVSEATTAGELNWDDDGGDRGGICRRRMLPMHTAPDEMSFLSVYKNYTLYRYDSNELSKIPYTPSIYSPMIDEGNTYPNYNYACLPIYGDKSITSTSTEATTRILVNMNTTQDAEDRSLPNITHIVVQRNGVDYGEPLEINTDSDTGIKYVDVTHAANDEAIYKAWVAAMYNDTPVKYLFPCTWITCAPTIFKDENFEAINRIVTINFTRPTKLFYPEAISFGGTAKPYSGNGYIHGRSTVIHNYTITEVIGGYEYEFTVKVPSLSEHGARVPYLIHLRNDDYGAIRHQQTGYGITNLND